MKERELAQPGYVRTAEETAAVDKLRAIVAGDFAVPRGEDPATLVLWMLDHLASPDPVLRDEYIVAVMGNWVFERDLLKPDELRAVLRKAMSDELLMRGIGETRTNSVFGRSFALLPIALVLVCDNRAPFLAEDEWRAVLDRLVDYCGRENELHGYVAGRGWAHAPAHAADALDECVRSRYADVYECARIWSALSALIGRARHVYADNEDERFAVPLGAMIELAKVPLDTVCQWIEAGIPPLDAEHSWVVNTNWKNVVRALYFQLAHVGLLGEAGRKRLLAADAAVARGRGWTLDE